MVVSICAAVISKNDSSIPELAFCCKYIYDICHPINNYYRNFSQSGNDLMLMIPNLHNLYSIC